jgi:hypothetical protein
VHRRHLHRYQPAGAAGTVDAQVTTPGGTSPTSAADHYTYVAPLAVTTAALPAATLRAAYTATLAAAGGTPPYTW